MKKIKRIQLKDATVMSNDEMKLLFGGSGSSMSGSLYCSYIESEGSSSMGCYEENISGNCGWNWKKQTCACKTSGNYSEFI